MVTSLLLSRLTLGIQCVTIDKNFSPRLIIHFSPVQFLFIVHRSSLVTMNIRIQIVLQIYCIYKNISENL